MNSLARFATVTAGGLAVLALGGPAAAHEEPQHEEFNTVLHDPHHDKPATGDETWPDCDTVRDRLGGDADLLIKDGHDVWVFYIPDGTFDTAGAVAQVEFRDPEGSVHAVTVPGGAYEFWIGAEGGETHLAIALPAGWTLADGEFAVTGSEHMVEVERTCPDGAEQATADHGLPVTGAQVGGMLILGGGLLAAGIAMSAVKRRRDLWDLLGEDAHHRS